LDGAIRTARAELKRLSREHTELPPTAVQPT
jgi:hypothetical protein